MASYAALILGAVLVNNFVLSQMLGICPFLGVSRRVDTAMGMGAAVVFVMGLASTTTALLNVFVLRPLHLGFMRTILFILVIAGVVQLVEILLRRFFPPLYRALGIYLPLITTNCAVLGAAVISARDSHTVLQAGVYGTASGVGFTLALLLFASLRERLDLARPPQCLRGTALALVTAGLLALAFMGFAGMGGG